MGITAEKKIKDEASLNSLTGLRFLAAMSVAAAHGASLTLGNSANLADIKGWAMTGAGFGMTLFFVLSGFVIHFNYFNVVTYEGKLGLTKFYWARFSRLYPLFFCLLAVNIFFGKAIPEYFNHELASIKNLTQVLPSYLLLVHSWYFSMIGENSLIYQVGNSMPVTWSISTEWFFYIAYPLVAFSLLKFRTRKSVFILSLLWSVFFVCATLLIYEKFVVVDSWAVSQYGSLAGFKQGPQDSFFRWILYFSPYSRIGEFGLGCMVAHIYLLRNESRVSDSEAKFAHFVTVAAVISIPLILYLTYSKDKLEMFERLQFNYGLAPFVGLLIYMVARYATPVSRMLSRDVIVRLGDASYSIYLVHIIIFSLAGAVGGSSGGTLGSIYLLIRFILLMVAVVLVAIGIDVALDRPIRKYLRSLVPQSGGIYWKNILFVIFIPLVLLVVSLAVNSYIQGESALSISNRIGNEGLDVISATYGGNCNAPRGNATQDVKLNCDGKATCAYVVDVRKLGDPANGCGKDFLVQYRCASAELDHQIKLPAEAGLGSVATMKCIN